MCRLVYCATIRNKLDKWSGSSLLVQQGMVYAGLCSVQQVYEGGYSLLVQQGMLCAEQVFKSGSSLLVQQGMVCA